MAKTSFFRRAMDAIIDARMREANRYIDQTLRRFDDDTLKANGFSPAQIKKAATSSHRY